MAVRDLDHDLAAESTADQSFPTNIRRVSEDGTSGQSNPASSPPRTPNNNAASSQSDGIDEVLSPPRRFYEPGDPELIDSNLYESIIEDINLKDKKSIIGHLPPPRGQRKNCQKPPNHIIARDNWSTCINSIAAYMSQPLDVRQREKKKAKQYPKAEADRYRRRIASLMANKAIDFEYDNGNGNRAATQRVVRAVRREAEEIANAGLAAEEAAVEEEVPNHIGLVDSEEERNRLIETDNPKCKKRRRLGEPPTSVAGQSDRVAQMAAGIAQLSVARAIDTSEFLDRSQSAPTNDFLLFQLNHVSDSNPAGGRLRTNCTADNPVFTMITSSAAAAKRILRAYRGIYSRDQEPHNYTVNEILREESKSMESTVKDHQRQKNEYRRAAARRHLGIDEVHRDITPTHINYLPRMPSTC
jgi:hypothetical protein